jgi:quercetin dioxygenase-like cupin family protein
MSGQRPAGAASIPHVHSRVSEAFYVLDGEFTFELDRRSLTTGAGTYVHVPAGVSHAWRVTGNTAARALVLFSPSVPLAFFEELDAVVNSTSGRPDRERLLALNQK